MASEEQLRDIIKSYDNLIVGMIAAVIEAENNGAESGIQWVKNALWGPGLLPSEENIKMGAQAYHDKNSTLWKGENNVGK